MDIYSNCKFTIFCGISIMLIPRLLANIDNRKTLGDNRIGIYTYNVIKKAGEHM